MGWWSRHRRVVVGGVVVCGALMAPWHAQAQHALEGEKRFSKEVEGVLQRKIDRLRELTEDPVILQAVRDSNATHADIPLADLLAVDRQWMARDEAVEPLVKSLLTNACANRLVVFQNAYDGYAEIFIADARGANVCLTNRTSGYYQADKDWWVQGYNDGHGKTFYGKIEHDDSAMVESIPVFLPIMDPTSQRAVGVMKVVVDITAIKREL